MWNSKQHCSMVDVWSWITFGQNNLCMPPEFKDFIVANRNFSGLFEKRKKVFWKSPRSSDLGNFLRLFLPAGLGFWFGINRFCQKQCSNTVQVYTLHFVLINLFKMPFYPPKFAIHQSFFQNFINVLTVRYDIFISHLFIFPFLLLRYLLQQI